MDVSFTSTLIVLLLVMDPIGNIPVFAALLRKLEPARRRLVIVRECAIAFGLLLFFVFFGRTILDLFGLSDSSLNIAGDSVDRRPLGHRHHRAGGVARPGTPHRLDHGAGHRQHHHPAVAAGRRPYRAPHRPPRPGRAGPDDGTGADRHCRRNAAQGH